MTVSEWQKRLSDTFTVNGLVGGSLPGVHSAEDAAGNYLVNTFRDRMSCSIHSRASVRESERDYLKRQVELHDPRVLITAKILKLTVLARSHNSDSPD
jgi:hypothetical protein